MAEPKVQMTAPVKPVEKEYVEIPEYDMFDNKIIVYHNHDQYEGGHRYLLPSDVAVEVKRLLKVREQADMSILSPRPDSKYKKQMEGRHPGNVVNVSE
jgi:hypothetical protein